MIEIIKKAEKFIRKNGTDLQISAMNFLGGRIEKKDLISSLTPYQNEDGGWGNGLEIEYQGDISTPMTTAAALGYIRLFDLSESELFKNTVIYLENTQAGNGSWDDTEAISKFDLPPYMGPGVYVEYKTGMILKWLKRIGNAGKLLEKGYSYMITVFPGISKTEDFWSAVSYINAFIDYPDDEVRKRIVSWAGSILSAGSTGPGSKEEADWFRLQGQILDDTPFAPEMIESTIDTVKQNQLPDGGWPHMFGIYNQVWAAVLIIRFLTKSGELTKKSSNS